MSWIGVDFDGTLATYDAENFPEAGEPIPFMVNVVRDLLAEGREVRIVTARASKVIDPNNVTYTDADCALLLEPVRRFCVREFGTELLVTSEKDFEMESWYDDRAVQVIPDVGIPVELLLQQAVQFLQAAGHEVAVTPNGLAISPARPKIWTPNG